MQAVNEDGPIAVLAVIITFSAGADESLSLRKEKGPVVSIRTRPLSFWSFFTRGGSGGFQ
jgi:hypothetical protein